MTIAQSYDFVNFCFNKEQRGTFPPAKFNLVAPIAQLEVTSKLLGNEQALNERGLPPYGYKSNRKIDTLLRPLVVGPTLITPDTFAITAITKANPGVVTFSGIGDLSNGDLVYITGVLGMTQVNGGTYMLANISGNTAQLKTTDVVNVNTTSYSTYVSGGTAYNGSWSYPTDMIWPDAIHKIDYTKITAVDSDEYPGLKKSHLHPPSSDYPLCVFREPKGYIDPINIPAFRLSYLATPPDPYWAYTTVNDEPVYSGSGSVDFAIHPLGHQRICQVILQMVGINLDSAQLLQYSLAKEAQGT